MDYITLVTISSLCVVAVIMCGVFAIGMTSKKLAIATIFFILLGACAGNAATEMDYNKEYKIEICSLSDNLGVHGSFVLGCGVVESKITYVALLDYGNNKYKQILIQNSNNEIFIQEDSNLSNIGYVCWEGGAETGKYYYYAENVTIHVPVGTVIKDFNINNN